MIKYHISFTGRIERVEIERETDKCVFVKWGNRIRRENKVTGWHSYFDTFTEAKNALYEMTEREIDNLKRSLDRAEKRLINCMVMEEPK